MGREQLIVDLFVATFAASEGADEGALIGNLVRNLLDDTAPNDLLVFIAEENQVVIGAAIFTRLAFDHDESTVFLLSPMAVATHRQGKGIGQKLLMNALAALREQDVDIVMTYGDPAFYGKIGFMPMSESTVPAPLPLSQPEGWIGQSLTGSEVSPLQGPSTCVDALDNTALW